jgi:lysophospholipase L1-like esterase
LTVASDQQVCTGENRRTSGLDKGERMNGRGYHRKQGLLTFVLAISALAVALPAAANTVTQNVSWTVDRSGTSTKYRVAAYGDSIYAGWEGDIWDVAIWSGANVTGDYASNYWGTDVEIIRRCKSGAIASDIYNNKIVNEAWAMQASDTRVVTFEMCGNDFLQARSSFEGQTGTCDYTPLNNALANCTTYQQKAMQYINANAYSGTKAKVAMTIYYPGYNADNKTGKCKDATTGQYVNYQNVFLPYLAHSNWRLCNFANTYGFKCADVFANFMGADYDTNGDGLVDYVELQYQQGESESSYVNRITTTQRSLLRDAEYKLVSPGTSIDYLQSDNTHPTYAGGLIWVGLFGGTGTGSAPPDFSPSQFVDGKNPIWNQYGHERMGWTLSGYNPPTP